VEPETQQHLLHDGKKILISRNGHHDYWLGDKDTKNKDMMSSVTKILKPLDLPFGAGMGWALKQARLAGGDLEAPRRASKETQDQGTLLHDAIDSYIKEGIVNEESSVFVSWLNKVGNHHEWAASEKFCYHPDPKFHYGGTVDALEKYSVIWDWKTKGESYLEFGPDLKDTAQISAYAAALRYMGSIYTPSKGFIAYIMRDGSGCDVVEVDLNEGWKTFELCHSLYSREKAWREAWKNRGK